jgi:hypothetical protein
VKTTTTLSDAEYYYDEYYDTVTPTQKPNVIEISSIKASLPQQKDERANFYNNRLPILTTTTTVASSPDSFRLNRYKTDNSRESYVETTTTRKPTTHSTTFSTNSKKYANKQTEFEHVTHETSKASQLSQQSVFQNLYNNRNLDKNQAQQQQQQKDYLLNEKEQKSGAVRVVKRPFLPSRGGNPYKARGLQPVGIVAEIQQQQPETQKVTLEDLYNEEYDVDLNDALNPMLKPLTSSRGVSGYSSLTNTPDVNDKDRYKAQSQKISNKADYYVPSTALPSTTTTTSTVASTNVDDVSQQPEYYDDEVEYSYADDVA